MKEEFFALSTRLASTLATDELLLCNLSAERSDFVRFNRALVRQAGTVEQRYLTLRLVRDGRQASTSLVLAGSKDDFELARGALRRLRETVAELPPDPWLLVNREPRSSTTERRGTVPPAEDVIGQVLRAARGRDLVGFYAGGTLYRGFANSLGQQNWHEVDSFNFDWSLYREGDQAVKTGYAGFSWSPPGLAAKMQAATQQLELLARERRSIAPGEYRAYLAPRALEDVLGLLSWGGFSARARETRQSPLLRMQEGERLSPLVTLAENTAEGVAPAFQAEGFARPPRVTLIAGGALSAPLVSPRSAKEYGLQTNGAGWGEAPESLDVAAGSLPEAEVLQHLGTGLYISNLWYLNFSDRPAGRITGMTRFATFWVENGKIVGPVTPMRFDDSLFHMLGKNLVALTRERELLPDTGTYGERQTSSVRLPGALLKGLQLTL